MSAREPILTARSLSRRYGQVLALDGVGLELFGGEVVALLGVNGAGKSTLMRILCGLDKAGGGDVSARSSLPLRRVVGYCPQHLDLWGDLTALEQVVMLGRLHGLSRATARSRATSLLDTLGIASRAHALAASLSGGMKRRLSIAMALIHDPEVLVLDEAEVGLDPQSRVNLREFVAHLAHESGRHVLLSTHNIDEVERVADRVLILDRGQIIARGTSESLVNSLGARGVVTITAPNASDASLERVARGVANALEGVEFQVSSGHLTLFASEPTEALEALLSRMREQEMEPGRVQVRRPGLEDVFLDRTGRRMGA